MILTAEQQSKFEDLCCALSPENLTCDGEASDADVKRELSQIRKEWRALEEGVEA